MVSPPHFAVFLAGRTLLKGMFTAHSGPGKKFQCWHTSPHKNQKCQFNAQSFFRANIYIQTWNCNNQRACQAPSWVLLIWKKSTLTISQHLAMLCPSWENREPPCLLREERNINWKWSNLVPKILILHPLHSNLKFLYTSSQYLMVVKSIPVLEESPWGLNCAYTAGLWLLSQSSI